MLKLIEAYIPKVDLFRAYTLSISNNKGQARDQDRAALTSTNLLFDGKIVTGSNDATAFPPAPGRSTPSVLH